MTKLNTTDGKIKVWDPAVRIFHWSLVTLFALAWVSAEEWDSLHRWSGYVIAGLVLFRLFWGVVGTRYARFSQFVTGPVKTMIYLKDMILLKEKPSLGHNPAGAWMIMGLLFFLLATAGSGWILEQTTWEASEWLEEVHEALAEGMLVLIALHVAGVLWASWRHGENLILSMLHGKKKIAHDQTRENNP